MSIKAGDLVVVTRPQPCCGHSSALGFVFRVCRVTTEKILCSVCSRRYVETVAWDLPNTCAPVSVLRRIDPLPESETQDNHESLTA